MKILHVTSIIIISLLIFQAIQSKTLTVKNNRSEGDLNVALKMDNQCLNLFGKKFTGDCSKPKPYGNVRWGGNFSWPSVREDNFDLIFSNWDGSNVITYNVEAGSDDICIVVKDTTVQMSPRQYCEIGPERIDN